MTSLVSNYFNIISCTVEIRENKRKLVISKFSTISTSGLTFFAQDIHKLIFKHCVNKFSGFWWKLVIKFTPGINNILGSALRQWISVTEFKCSIGKGKRVFHSGSLSLFTVKSVCNRNYIFQYRAAEPSNIFRSIAIPCHLKISKTDEIVISEFFCHFITKTDHFIIDIV